MTQDIRRDPALHGIITAILTPVTRELEVDTGRLLAHGRALLEDGCTRISTFGSTGEGVSFSAAQRLAAHQSLLMNGIRPEQLLPAIMATSVQAAGEELGELARLGCRHVLVLPPFYYRNATVDGLVSYFEALFEKAGRPEVSLVLYNIPAMTGIVISHELVRKLQAGAGARIAGIKDSTGDVESGLAYVRAFPELRIFTGDDRVLRPLVEAGGAGMIGGLPNLYARDLVALLNSREPKETARLAALAAERIAYIDDNGGLLALKSELADRTNDLEWLRAMAPLGSEFRSRAS